jgi:outer membrane receptor protein involved in Fe transport
MWTRTTTCFLWLSAGATSALHAQGIELRGTITTGSQQPVEFATVVLFPAHDSTHQVQAVVADAAGGFVLRGVAPGTYRLRASFVGLLPATQPVDVRPDQAVPPLHLQLAALPKQLGEVKVTATRSPITQLPDRLVMDVASTPLAAGYTALEVLQKAPGVYVDPRSESVSLNGKGTLVMLNGKRTYLSGTDLAALLKSLPSQELQKVELITSPGARYDAEGPGGIINIVTRKSQLDGTRGTLTLGAGGTTNSRQTAGFTLNHKQGKVALYGGYTAAGRQTVVFDDSQTDYLAGPEGRVTTTHLLNSVSPTNQLAHNVKAGLDWQVLPKTSLSLYIRGLRTDRTTTINAATRLLHPQAASDSVLSSLTNTSYYSTQYAGNLGLRQQLDSARTLSLDVDGSVYESASTNRIDNAFITEQGSVPGLSLQLRNYLPTTIHIGAAQADYEQRRRNGATLALGVKHSYVGSANDARYELLRGGEWQNDRLRTNDFQYRENISAAYASYAGKLRKLDYRLGLRLEHTASVGNLLTTGAQTTRDYTSLFPSVLVSQAVGKSSLLSLAYSRRIRRPSYQSLNPFVYFQDVYTNSQGNPFLRPEYTQGLDLTYTLRGTYVLALGYSQTSDVIAWVTQRQEPGSLVTQTQAQNLNRQRQWTLTANAPYSPWKWWTITSALSANYTIFYLQAVANAPSTVQGLSGVYSLSNDFSLRQGWRLVASGYFQSALPNGVTQQHGQFSANLGVQKKLMQDKLMLRAIYNDVLRTARSVSVLRLDNLRSYDTYRWDSNFFSVTLTYQFGNQKVKTATKSRIVSGDEEGRIK